MTGFVVLDIEGTTSPLSYVRERLFPYARHRIAAWLRRPDPVVEEVVEQVREIAELPDASREQVAEVLCRWTDQDRKEAPLKTLQGLIWQAGFASGELVAQVYDDVPPALRSWSARGLRLYVYSSGSMLAQQLWFQHTQHGDLRALFCGYFDLENAGPKREPASYRAISHLISAEPADTIYLSDLSAELDAAAAAGWQTVGIRRPDNVGCAVGDHPAVTTFDEFDPGAVQAAGAAVMERGGRR